MSRTLAELATEYKTITKEADVLWEREWKPKFEATTSETEFTRLLYQMLAAADVQWSDDLPGLLQVELVFQRDLLRKRMKT